MNTILSFKNSLNYSTCNEDSLTEVKSLKINKNDRVLCVTGSGGRVLNLLTEDLKEIVAVDFNITQNWLLELKMAAIKHLNYGEFSKFIGLVESKERWEIYNSINGDLSQESKRYWEKNKRYITNGILFQGEFERKCRFFSNALQEAIGDEVSKVLSFDNLEKQREYYEHQWDHSHWQKSIDMHNAKMIDPAFYLYVKKEYQFKEFILEVLDKGFKSHLAKENHFLCFLIDGNYKRTSRLPLYLREENFNKLKRDLDKIKIVTDNIVNYLKNHKENYYSKFSLSDVTGYLSHDDCRELYRYTIRSASEDSRICMRSLLAEREIPEEYDKTIIRERELEEQLERDDLSLMYKIIVGSVFKGNSTR